MRGCELHGVSIEGNGEKERERDRERQRLDLYPFSPLVAVVAFFKKSFL